MSTEQQEPSEEVQRIAKELYQLLVSVRTYSEHLKSIEDFLAREFAAKDAEIARLKDEAQQHDARAEGYLVRTERAEAEVERLRRVIGEMQKLHEQSLEHSCTCGENPEDTCVHCNRSISLSRLAEKNVSDEMTRTEQERDQLRAEVERLKQSHGQIYLALGSNEADHTKWPKQIADLRDQLAARKQT